MYLAKDLINGKKVYFIRESIEQNGVLSSRTLFELGPDPGRYIIYPGGTAFYIHGDIHDRLGELGVEPDNVALEQVFWPFLHPETRRVIEGFTRRNGRKESIREQNRRCETTPFHMFDMRRIHYLRFAQIDQTRLSRAPRKIYRPLLDKSRDEIEQYFMEQESVLDADEKKTYTYVIFNVAGHFPGEFSKKFPHALARDKVDEYFLEEVCRLDADASFWTGLPRSDALPSYLVRYVCWFFDHEFAQVRLMENLFSEWMDRHRQFTPPPQKSRMAADEASEVMGIPVESLSNMTVKNLTRQYRKMAKQHHPDQGGGHDRFIKLSEAYKALLRKIRGGKMRFSTSRG